MRSTFNIFYQILQRDLCLAYRRLPDVASTLLFFLIVVLMFPIAVTPDYEILKSIAPGIIWIAILLANFLTFDRLFAEDDQDGSLQSFLLSPQPLSLMVAAKMLAHWLSSSLPFILITPLLGMMLHLTGTEIFMLVMSLLLGTPALSVIGAVISALTVGLSNSGILLSILLLPLIIPLVILGVMSVLMSASGISPLGILALLTAFTLVCMSLGPFAAAAALRS